MKGDIVLAGNALFSRKAADQIPAIACSSEGVNELFENLVQCCQITGKPERLEIFSYNASQTFPTQAQQQMPEWLTIGCDGKKEFESRARDGIACGRGLPYNRGTRTGAGA